MTKECTYQGDCKGTCPKCEAELRYLEEQLACRQKLGKRIAVAAVATTLLAGAGVTYAYNNVYNKIQQVVIKPDPSVITAGYVIPAEELEGEVEADAPACETTEAETAPTETTEPETAPPETTEPEWERYQTTGMLYTPNESSDL